MERQAFISQTGHGFKNNGSSELTTLQNLTDGDLANELDTWVKRRDGANAWGAALGACIEYIQEIQCEIARRDQLVAPSNIAQTMPLLPVRPSSRASETTLKAFRYHDFSYGHCVHNHESKCAHLHGHNGRVVFYCEAPGLDSIGRVIDFSVIKSTLCEYVEASWDHRFLVYEQDSRANDLCLMDPTVVVTPFNPTAENMAEYLLCRMGPVLLEGTSVTLIKVELWETRKCGVVAEL